MSTERPYKSWLGYLRVLPIIFVILTMANFWYADRNQGYDKRYVMYATQVRLISQHLAADALEAANEDNEIAYQNLKVLREQIVQQYMVLKKGKFESGKWILPPSSQPMQEDALSKFIENWELMKPQIDIVLENRNAVISASKMTTELVNALQKIKKTYWDVLRSEGQEDVSKITSVVEELDRTEMVSSNLQSFLDLSSENRVSEKDFVDSVKVYLEKAKEIQEQNKDRKLAEKFKEINLQLDFLRENYEKALNIEHLLDKIRLARGAIYNKSIGFLDAANQLVDAYSDSAEKHLVSHMSAYVLMCITFIILIISMYVLYRDGKSDLDEMREKTRIIKKEVQDLLDKQAQGVVQILSTVSAMAISLEEVALNANKSAAVALEAVTIANEGGKTLRNTISGMEHIQEKIQGTTNSMLLLNVSSQEIGDIISLIDGIAEQTNILSLNASIQAAMAGEAGKGFAVVPDEVQRLAEKVGYATKEVASLVTNIQKNTNNAVTAMAQTRADVEEGTTLVKNAGAALERIQSISKQLSDLVQNISSSATEQSNSSKTISKMMSGIKDMFPVKLSPY